MYITQKMKNISRTEHLGKYNVGAEDCSSGGKHGQQAGPWIAMPSTKANQKQQTKSECTTRQSLENIFFSFSYK